MSKPKQDAHDVVYLPYEGESSSQWEHRVVNRLGIFEPGDQYYDQDVDGWEEDERKFVEAKYGVTTVKMLRPPSEFCSHARTRDKSRRTTSATRMMTGLMGKSATS